MGLLDKLWDDTVAGPRPDTGLGRLRKHAARPAAVKINDAAGDAVTMVPPTTPAAGEEAPVRVTRSIMIKRPAGCPASPRSAASTPPVSPAGSTPPISPFAGAGEPTPSGLQPSPCPNFFGRGSSVICDRGMPRWVLSGSSEASRRGAGAFRTFPVLVGALARRSLSGYRLSWIHGSSHRISYHMCLEMQQPSDPHNYHWCCCAGILERENGYANMPLSLLN